MKSFLFFVQLFALTCGVIDMTLEQYEYIASQLTLEECRYLVASLHFVSYNLPAALAKAVKKVPQHEPCINLLLKWNFGGDKWEGKGKTHEEVERRLRQFGKRKLANWLGVTVFHQLAKDIEETILNDSHLEVNEKAPYSVKPMEFKHLAENINWPVFDFLLWIILFSLLGMLAVMFSKSVYQSYTSRRKVVHKSQQHEMVNLLKAEGSILDDGNEREFVNIECK